MATAPPNRKNRRNQRIIRDQGWEEKEHQKYAEIDGNKTENNDEGMDWGSGPHTTHQTNENPSHHIVYHFKLKHISDNLCSIYFLCKVVSTYSSGLKGYGVCINNVDVPLLMHITVVSGSPLLWNEEAYPDLTKSENEFIQYTVVVYCNRHSVDANVRPFNPGPFKWSLFI